MVWALFGVNWVMPQSVMDLFIAWQGSFGRQCNVDLWRAVPNCVLCVYGEKGTVDALRKRNSRSSRLNLSSTLLLDWSSVFNSFSCSNLLDLLDHCNL